MNEVEKLQVLIPHWIEHNNEHADEFRRWAERAGNAAPDILAAAESLSRASCSLAAALEILDEAVPGHYPQTDVTKLPKCFLWSTEQEKDYTLIQPKITPNDGRIWSDFVLYYV